MDAHCYMFGQFARTGVGDLLLSLAAFVVLAALPAVFLGTVLNYLLSLPLRRRERARFFLDLLEAALARGESPEQALVAMAAVRDRAPGVRFHQLAAHLEAGRSLIDALQQVPRLVPAGVSAMLAAGVRMGNLRRVLPACRKILQEGSSDVEGALHYALVLLLTFSPLAIWITGSVYIFVLPKFGAIMEDFQSSQHWAMLFVLRHPGWVIGPQVVLLGSLLVATWLYLGGPRAQRWLRWKSLPLLDWIVWWMPWKRQRALRTFSMMLASLLDNGVPEAEAVRLAAECVDNAVIRQRARAVNDALAQGRTLPDAIEAVDRQGEFRWRLRNAAHGGGFLAALQGWHQALEATAYRLEQTAAHAVSTLMILLNGSVVVLLALATFGSLMGLLETAVLW